MFTTAELVRIVIKRLKISSTLKQEWLLRRAVKPTRTYTKREFRKLRRQYMPLIHACVDEMNIFIANGGITQAEEDYYSRVGEAPVDKVFNTVSRLSVSRLSPAPSVPPPELHRTCTGYFGTRCTSDEVAFKHWEA
tara:strand:- start:2279 stop:2686 length:408 start_codon:yes stop_codon:yes gene_type:complete